MFYQKQDGEVVLSNASAQAIRKAQYVFSGAAEAMGISNEEDVQMLVEEVRYGKDLYGEKCAVQTGRSMPASKKLMVLP